MKNIFYVPFSALVLVFCISSCKPKVDIAKEEESIKAVINAETQAWIDRDPEKMKQYYVQDEYQTRLNIQDSIYRIITGWENRSPAMDSLTRNFDWEDVDKFKVEKDFLVIKVKDNAAWAIFKETQNMVYRGSPATAVSIIDIMLEKNNQDEWKIACFIKSSI
jgi:lysine/ornithine N-monooxygenase